MYRKIEQKLMNWKQEKEKQPLIIRGARQVGKSYSILKFGNANYEAVIELNFERDLDAKAQFETSLRPSDILAYLQLQYHEQLFGKKEVLLFLDEVQACPNALTALKFLATECPYDIIASGSLLGVAIAASTSYPVGYVKTWDLLPMDFEEFLWANGISEQQIDMVRQAFEKGQILPQGIHQVFIRYLKNYILCGGMPAVVKDFVTHKDFMRVRDKQQQIMKDYQEDIAKYATSSEKVKVHECFASIPLQLAKENKKFQYKLVKNGGAARHYEGSLQWLKDSGLILPCYRLKAIQAPLMINKELNVFKVYLFDTGLLLSQFRQNVSSAIFTDEPMIYKGAIYENLAAQMLRSKGYELTYFEPSTRSEIDFVLEMDTIVPIEIKSSTNTISKSLQAFVEKYHTKQAYKFSLNNVNCSGDIQCYPIYMLMFL